MLSVKTQFIYLFALWDESDIGAENGVAWRQIAGFGPNQAAGNGSTCPHASHVRILETATAGHDSLEHIDWAALERVVHEQLTVLEGAH